MKKVFEKIFMWGSLCFMVCFIGMMLFLVISGIINTVRKSRFDINIPKTPIVCSSHDYSGDFVAEYKLTDISYKIDGNDIIFNFEGKKTYDVDGADEAREINIVWQLQDSDGNIVAGDDVSSPELEVGEKFSVESKDYSFNVNFEKDYQLAIKNQIQNTEAKSNDESKDKNQYEDLFLGKWSNEEAILSFQYKDNVYCGGVMSNEMALTKFVKYTASEDTIIIYTEHNETTAFDYEFENGCLYLDGLKFEKFSY